MPTLPPVPPHLADLQRKVAEVLAAFPRRSAVAKLYVFGSTARGEATAASDVDLLAELREPMGFDFFGLEIDLETVLSQKVDLVTIGFISRYIRDKVEHDKILLYAAD